MSHQKLAEKYRTVVCRHWLRGLCMKGDNCEFLHQMDMDRMPVCRWGENCRIKDCPYKHEAEADKPQCVFYQQGFCYHGPECRYRHWKQAADKRPAIADFSLGIAQGRDFKQAAAERRRPSEARPVGRPALCGARRGVVSLCLCVPLSLTRLLALSTVPGGPTYCPSVSCSSSTTRHHWKIVSTRGLTSPGPPPRRPSASRGSRARARARAARYMNRY